MQRPDAAAYDANAKHMTSLLLNTQASLVRWIVCACLATLFLLVSFGAIGRTGPVLTATDAAATTIPPVTAPPIDLNGTAVELNGTALSYVRCSCSVFVCACVHARVSLWRLFARRDTDVCVLAGNARLQCVDQNPHPYRPRGV